MGSRINCIVTKDALAESLAVSVELEVVHEDSQNDLCTESASLPESGHGFMEPDCGTFCEDATDFNPGSRPLFCGTIRFPIWLQYHCASACQDHPSAEDKMQQHQESSFSASPASTPIISGDRIYTQSQNHPLLYEGNIPPPLTNDNCPFSDPALHATKRSSYNNQEIANQHYQIFETKSARPHPDASPQTDNSQNSELQHAFSQHDRRGEQRREICCNQKWPFLLRFPISSFGITLGLGSQTIMWKHLAATPSMHFLHLPHSINLFLWFTALVATFMISATFILKCMFYFEAVRREYYHPVRVNYFFAPWIACMFLTLGLPSAIATSVHPAVWCIFMAPLLCLELKIYGQWLSGGERRLSKVANPSTHLAVVGSFVGALLGATVGWKEVAIFFWAIGLAHYLVLFVTLYQRLPTNESLPKELRPVFFLFVSAPSTASVAWEEISGDFDFVSKILYFVALFLFTTLALRLNLFRGLRFSIAWWAYTFPMTAASIATIHYSNKVTTPITQALAILFSCVSTTVVFTLFLLTLFHTFVWGTLFPNDLAIAIAPKRHKTKHKSKRISSLTDISAHTIDSSKPKPTMLKSACDV
ncbi:hypothetical protein O6H91_12G006100 [Diphasiastrum complanatum]|uniref:Uncharacterized protein n=2 Tax=Diphasiastrum complanatum TaxID=34168 RepID=A0ACC2BYY1_DIPCM|nr:hypothetical protein O6H91_12G006100 [Diphasiastrum complanatum]KAJ7534834.1 hypothetical protein O6H91_12G006100 [Diphasiastrum complanatum]